MARKKEIKKRVYRETLFPIIESKMTKAAFSEQTGHGDTYINSMFTIPYRDVSERAINLWAFVLDVPPEDITAIPTKAAPTNPAPAEVNVQTEALEALICDGFRMIHQDLLELIATMEKYWKPEMPTIDRGQADRKE